MMAYSLHLPHVFVVVVIALTVSFILIVMADAHTPTDTTPSYIIKYTTITGYFLQDDPKTNASTFDYVTKPSQILSPAPPFFSLWVFFSFLPKKKKQNPTASKIKPGSYVSNKKGTFFKFAKANFLFYFIFYRKLPTSV